MELASILVGVVTLTCPISVPASFEDEREECMLHLEEGQCVNGRAHMSLTCSCKNRV